jgi:sugar-specific transcriptional regulator TrmB
MNEDQLQIRENLEALGLTEHEIAIYLASLELGESSIIPIKKRIGLPRTTVFRLLEQLKAQGIIEIIETPTRRLYVPYPPRKIVTLLNNQAEKFKEKAENLQNILPELNKLYSASPFQPKVRFFVGDEIEQIYNEILESPIEELLYIGETNKLTSILSKQFFAKWVKKKVEKNIWTRSIRVREQEDLFFDPRKDLRKARFAPKGFEAPSHTYVYHNNVAILTSAKENFGVVITSHEFAATMKNTFQELWKISTMS